MAALVPARLNVFQQLARTWEQSEPYNAAQIVRVRCPIDADRAGASWADTLRSLGLGRVQCSGSRYAHHVLNGEMKRYPPRMLASDTALDAFLTEELNRSFDDPVEPPFRPFVQDEGKTCCLGIVYQHWVADSVSIRSVLKAWLRRLIDPLAACSNITHDANGYWDMVSRQGRGAELGGMMLYTLRTHLNLRRVRKPQPMAKHDRAVRVMLRTASEGFIDRLRDRCRDASLRVSDVLLAALAEASNAYVPMQSRPNRRGVAIGNVVDLRPHTMPRVTASNFGVYLGFTIVTCTPSKLRDFEKLTRHIHSQIQSQRRIGIAQAGVSWMGVADAWTRRIYRTRPDYFFRKTAPLAAGLSNVVLDETWPGSDPQGRIVEFLRVSPTGPIAPVVLTTTTLRSSLQLGLTFRTALLCERRAGAMLDMVQRRLGRFADGDFCETRVDNSAAMPNPI